MITVLVRFGQTRPKTTKKTGATMNKDTITIYETILEAVYDANNALVAVRRGDNSAALSDLSNARRSLEVASDSLRRGHVRTGT